MMKSPKKYGIDLLMPEPKTLPKWIEDSSSNNCMKCNISFTVFNRRHHCRYCGKLFCDQCSSQRLIIPDFHLSTPQRCCETCINTISSLSFIPHNIPTSSSVYTNEQLITKFPLVSSSYVQEPKIDELHKNKNRKPRILLGLTGSVACTKAEELVKGLLQFAEVRVVTTEKALHFLDEENFKKIVMFFTDTSEWEWKKSGDDVLHIELRKWADLFLVAPLSANTLGKLSTGICDNLVTCVARAWHIGRPFLVAPAMNTNMYIHPLTTYHLKLLGDLQSVRVISPVSKKLACGDEGIGAMASIDTIVSTVTSVLKILNFEI